MTRHLCSVPTDTSPIKHVIDLDDGTQLVYYADGSVWQVHPVVGRACLREATGGAA